MAFWAVGLTALVVLAGHIEEPAKKLPSIIPLDSPAIKAELRSVKQFGFPLSSRIVVVQRDPDGLSPIRQAQAVLAAVEVDRSPQAPPLLGALPLTNSVRLSGTMGEVRTSVITYLFMNPRSSFNRQERAAQAYIDEHLNEPEDHVVGVAGSIPARAEQATLVTEYLPRMEILTLLAIVALVAGTFRSVIAPVLALGASAVAYLATLQLSTILESVFGVTAPAELEPLLVALLLGIVTDYTIFYLSALRGRVDEATSWQEAVVEAVSSYTPIIVAAGLTVAAGTAALLAATSQFFQEFAPAMALSVLVGLAVSTTLIPALLAILGPRVFWPRRQPTTDPVWVKPERVPGLRRQVADLQIARRLTRRSTAAVVLAGCLLLLFLAAIPLRNIDLGVSFTASLPGDNPVKRASTASAAAFAPGINSPTTLLLESPDVTSQTRALTTLQKEIQQQPGVALVVGPADNFTQREFNVVLARSGDAARMLVAFDNDPLGSKAIASLTELQDALPGLLAETGLEGVTVSIAGDTALAADLVESTKRDLWRIAAAAIVINLLILIMFLRALVAPLYLLASSVLALAAALGLTVGLFVEILGYDDLTFYVPFAAAVLLVSLGSDYNIFGVGYVWELAGRMPLPSAIAEAIPATTRAITAAGVTLAVSFGMLAVIPLRPFRELAFAMVVGILIDVVIVRSLMVPSLLTLFGRLSGWPGRHFRQVGASEAPPQPQTM